MKIYPSFDLPFSVRSSLGSFIESLGNLVEEILPKDLLSLLSDPDEFHRALDEMLPFVSWSRLESGGNVFEATILCHSEYSHGTGRFLSDALSRRLIPGKTVELEGTRTLAFSFFPGSAHEFLINQRVLCDRNPASVELIPRNLPILADEIRLTLLSVFKARRFLSLHPGTERSEALAEMLHLSTYEEMHQIVRRLTAEQIRGNVRSHIEPVYRKRPKVFDRDIFEEFKPFIGIYGDRFIGERSLPFIARLICCHYYFKKRLKIALQSDPLSRQILVKTFRLKGRIGILTALNLFGENELLKKRHLVDAVQNCLPDYDIVHDSFCMDNSSEYRPVFYLEANKKDGPVSSQDILSIRTHLPLELKQGIQSVMNPLFMPRNEEDQLRLIISLSRELRYVRDLPQVAISFEEQTVDELSFSVVLLRVLKKGDCPIRDLLSQMSFTVRLRDARHMGLLRNKYPKEFVTFSAHLPKQPFLRKDHSLDLPKARQALLANLNHLFKEVRDFNGGLLSKQLETLQHLKDLLGRVALQETFLLENYFFSLEPSISQTSMSPSLLKMGFQSLLKRIRGAASFEVHHCNTGVFGCFVQSSVEARTRFLSLLETARDSFERVSYSAVSIHDLYYVTVFLSSGDARKQREFENFLNNYLSKSFEIEEAKGDYPFAFAGSPEAGVTSIVV